MKRTISLLLVMLIAVFLSCSKDSTKPKEEETPINEFNVMMQYLEGAGGNYVNTACPKIISASALVQDGIANWKILDIRSADTYAKGHIDGAINVSFGDAVNYVKEHFTKTDKILVACYTGQSAGHVVLALNLLGYDATSLLFGMSSWNKDFDSWTGGCSSDYASHFTTDATPVADAGDYPTFASTAKTTGEEILAARVDAMMANGFKGVSAADLLANKDDYYIVNYFGADDYNGAGACPPGHISGARQYTPKESLQSSKLLNTLPTDKKIAVYCWTGQTSSQVVAFLNVLGYDAYSVKFGVNGMVHDQLTAHTWSDASIAGLTYVK